MKIDNNLLLHTVPMTLIRSRSLSSSALGILITNKHFTLIPPTYSAQNAYTQKVKVCIVISSQVNIGDALSKSHLFKKSATVGQIPMSINQHPKTSSKLWDPWHSTVVIIVINVVVFFMHWDFVLDVMTVVVREHWCCLGVYVSNILKVYEVRNILLKVFSSQGCGIIMPIFRLTIERLKECENECP